MFTPRRAPEPLPDAIPQSYVVLRTTTHCAHCGSEHSTEAVMVRSKMDSRSGLGKPLTQMRVLEGMPLYVLPIERQEAPFKVIPFCTSCMGERSFREASGSQSAVHPALSQLPIPPQEDKRILSVVQTGPQKVSEADCTGDSGKRATKLSVNALADGF